MKTDEGRWAQVGSEPARKAIWIPTTNTYEIYDTEFALLRFTSDNGYSKKGFYASVKARELNNYLV